MELEVKGNAGILPFIPRPLKEVPNLVNDTHGLTKSKLFSQPLSHKHEVNCFLVILIQVNCLKKVRSKVPDIVTHA